MRATTVLCLAFLAALPLRARAQDRGGHDALHSWYQGLRSPEGESCCNAKDCRPVASRFVQGSAAGAILEIQIGSRWIPVPKDRILPLSSPDGGVHACYSDPAPFMTETTPGLVIRCVVTGGLS
jgi:hypothetical protein